MIFIFYILAALLIYLSYKSFRGGLDYLNYFKAELAKPASDFTPFATIIAPCRGPDDGLEQNLEALLRQDFPDYEVIFVVDDKDDAAVSVIEEVSRKAAKDAKKTKLVIAAKSKDSSQKVENLREAVLHVSVESRVFVFVDSDARPAKEWLRNLVAPLADENIGAATGYRWFISKTPTFGSEMRSAWNASIASALGANTKSNFCWGGSMAVRRDIFEKLDIRKKWRGTLSDDFTVTRAMNSAGLPIVFVPQALTASVENCTLREMLEFTTRQMKITRVYASSLWKLSFFGSGLFCTVMVSALLIAIFSRENDMAVFAAIATLVLVSLFSLGKAWLRLKAVRLVLPQYEKELRQQTFAQLTLWLLTPAVFFYNSYAAWSSRRMTWRGITYELVSPTETRVLSDEPRRR
jgi:ceramide glucosyltransferase